MPSAVVTCQSASPWAINGRRPFFQRGPGRVDRTFRPFDNMRSAKDRLGDKFFFRHRIQRIGELNLLAENRLVGFHLFIAQQRHILRHGNLLAARPNR